jgi:uncharacterized phage protein (TIGR01671 family)
MRDIKFRFWVAKNGWEDCRDGMEMFYWDTKTADNCVHLRDKEPMQFTGLFDKNRKEIYEGDVLRRAKDGEKYRFYIVVEFKNGSFGGSTRPGFNHYLTAERWGCCDSDGGGYDEVIGNIYENPELISN